MLSANDIKNIAQSGEGYNAEFKVRVPNKVKELTEEICAFANAAGGVLLIGVDCVWRRYWFFVNFGEKLFLGYL